MLPSFATRLKALKTVPVSAPRPLPPTSAPPFGFNGNFNGKMTKINKMAKNHFSGVQNGSQSVQMGALGGVFALKSGLRTLIRAPEVPPSAPPKTPKMGVFGYFGGTENGTSGARIEVLGPLFNTSAPPKTPIWTLWEPFWTPEK